MFRLFKTCLPDSKESREDSIVPDDDNNHQKLYVSQEITDSESSQHLGEIDFSITEKISNQHSHENSFREEFENFWREFFPGSWDECKEEFREFLSEFWNTFKKLTAFGIPAGLSFTYSLAIFLVAVLIHRMTSKEDELAAIALIVTMMHYVAVPMSFLFAMSGVASKHIGAMKKAENENDYETVGKKELEIAQVYKAGMLLALPLSAAALGPLVFSKPLLELFQQNSAVAENTAKFTKPFTIAIYAVFVRLVAEQMMLSANKQNHAMIIGLVSLAIGVGIAIWLGHGGLGIEPMGLAGIATGFTVDAWLTAIAYTLYIGFAEDLRRYHFFDITNLNGIWDQTKNILAIGQSIFFSMGTEIGINLAMGFLAGVIGVRPQAALTYIMQYTSFVFLFSLAFAQGCFQEIFKSIGARDFRNASLEGRYGLLTSFLWIAPIPFVVPFISDLLLQSNIQNRKEMADMVYYLSIMLSVAVVADAMRYNLLQQLRSIGDINLPTLLSIFILTAGIIVGGVTGLKTSAGIYGLVGAYSASMLLATMGLMVRWATKIDPKIIEELNPEPEEVRVEEVVEEIQEENKTSDTKNFGLMDNFFQTFTENKENTHLITNITTYATAGMGNTG